MTITKDIKQTVSNLRIQGVKFNIMTEVDRRVELHQEIELLNGKSQMIFVAEIDAFGNIVDWGSSYRSDSIAAMSDVVYNADGEEV